MPTSTLSQLLPALTFLRSAANSGSRPTVKARPATRETPRRTHAFDQSRRPADPKRHTAVIVRLKQIETTFFTSACRIITSLTKYFIISDLKIHIRTSAKPRLIAATRRIGHHSALYT